MFALQNGWIDPSEEDSWISLLKDRNLTTHTYDQSFAQEVLGRIQKEYVGMFGRLLSILEKQA